MNSPTRTIVELHNPEVDDLMGQSPRWLVRWGTSVLFIVLISLGAVSWFVRYPDLVRTHLYILTNNPPRPVIARTDGRIVHLLVKEEEHVQTSQALAYLESTARHNEVLRLLQQLERAGTLLKQNRLFELNRLDLTNYNQLGELQSNYQTFFQTYSQLVNHLSNGFYDQKQAVLQQELTHLKALYQNLLDQRGIQERDVKLAQEEYAIQQTLAEQKVIAPLDLKREESKNLNRQLPMQQLTSSLINNQLMQRAKEKEVMELTKLVDEQRVGFIQALNTLKSAALAWKTRYVLSAPITGQVTWSTPLQEEQTVKLGQQMGHITPKPGNEYAYVGEALIGQYNFGKVKTGQEVLLKLPSYPFQEFGMVIGRVGRVSQVATDTAYRAQILLPNGLQTTTGRRLNYSNGLVADGEIVTEDTRLLEKLVYEIRKLRGR